jgi:hypothetical protein
MLLQICIKLGDANGGSKDGKEAFWRWRTYDKYGIIYFIHSHVFSLSVSHDDCIYFDCQSLIYTTLRVNCWFLFFVYRGSPRFPTNAIKSPYEECQRVKYFYDIYMVLGRLFQNSLLYN